MAFINFTRTEAKGIRPTSSVFSWNNMTESDTAQPLFLSHSADKSVQMFGTWGGSTVSLQGTNDPRIVSDPDNAVWDTLVDTDHTAISYTSSDDGKIKTILPNVLAIRPSQPDGASVSLTICITSNGG